MKIFLAIIAVVLLLFIGGTKDNEERKCGTAGFITVLLILGALEIIPLFI